MEELRGMVGVPGPASWLEYLLSVCLWANRKTFVEL